MKAAIWYLVAGLEVWLGVCSILVGLYLLVTAAVEHGDASSSVAATLGAIAAIVLGVSLVVDAIRRELGERGTATAERFGNPLDTPTRPGHA